MNLELLRVGGQLKDVLFPPYDPNAPLNRVERAVYNILAGQSSVVGGSRSRRGLLEPVRPGVVRRGKLSFVEPDAY